MNNGEKLEKEVERIYILLGAKETKRRTLIKIYEIDVTAKFLKGPIEFTVIVECKEYNRRKLVSDEEMKNFVVKLLSARECGKADKGVFVTTSGYSKNALATAQAHNIQCLTLTELYNQLVDFSIYINETIEVFNKTDLSKWYIKQKTSDVEDYYSISKDEKLKVTHNSAIDYLNELIDKEKIQRIALLGNFGTGKTSLCIKYRYELLQLHIKNPERRIPILINLRDFRAGIDIHQLITNELQKLPGIDIDLKLCLELQRMGRFIFILDGLDEMATKVDRIVINENLREIDRLFSENDNVYLLTCRTHFFQERIADEFLKDYRILFLMDWSHWELKEYLQKRFAEQWSDYLEKITSKLTLEELAKTPMLLDMIVNSLSKITSETEVNLISLYRTYTDDWIEKQSKRRGAIMNTSQRRKFVELIAKKIYIDGTSSIHFSEMYEIAKDISGYTDVTRIDYFDTDARTSTFVTKDSVGNYNFYHRSFMEFFCANIIIHEINFGNPDLLSQKDISNEVFELLELSNINKTSGIKNLQHWSKIFKEVHLSRNSTQLLLRLNQKIDKLVEKHFGFTKSKWDALEQAFTNNDAKVIELFYKDYYSKLKKMAFQLSQRYALDPSQEIDDVVQDLLLKLWKTMKDGKLKSNSNINLDSFLYSTLKRVMVDKFLLRSRIESYSIEDLTEEKLHSYSNKNWQAQDNNSFADVNTWGNIETALIDKYKVDSKYISAFYSVYKDGEKIENISQELGITVRSLRVILNRLKHSIVEIVDSFNYIHS